MWKKVFSRLIDVVFGLYIIADANDNSITLSKKLVKRLRLMELNKAKAFVFAIPDTEGHYGITINPELSDLEHLPDIQYNSKYKCIGFESLCPTVNRIFYDYGLPSGISCKLLVKEIRTEMGLVYYQICKPYGKFARKQYS